MVSIGTNQEVNLNGRSHIRENFKIVFLGDIDVGKTAIINKFFYNQTVEAKPTEGIDMTGVNVKLNCKEVRLIIWDISGKESYQKLLDLYVKETFAVFLIYDITNRASFDNIKETLDKIMKIKEERLEIFVIGNKADLTKRRMIMESEAQQLASEFKVVHVETSSETGKGFDIIKKHIEESFNSQLNQDKVALDNKIICSLI